MTTSSLVPIARSTAAEACTRTLRERILGGAFLPGTKLPPERTLATDLGVNRVTVRTALATLAAEQLVKIRHGSGAVVGDFLENGGPGLIAELVALARGDAAIDAVADLLTVRRALARVALARVVERIDDAGRGRLHSAVQAFARALDESRAPQDVAAADLEVMRAVVAETRSPVLQLCMNPIAAVLVSLPGLCAAMFAEPERSLSAWEALVDALARPRHELTSLPDLTIAALEAHDAFTLEKLATHSKRRRP